MSPLAKHFAPLDVDELNDFTTDLALLDAPRSKRRSFKPSVPPLLSEESVRHWDTAPLF